MEKYFSKILKFEKRAIENNFYREAASLSWLLAWFEFSSGSARIGAAFGRITSSSEVSEPDDELEVSIRAGFVIPACAAPIWIQYC